MIQPIYRLIWGTQAAKFLSNLTDAKLSYRLHAAAGKLLANPLPSGCKKLAGQPHYRLRVGDYRIIYEIRRQQLIVNVVKIGHRKDVYR
jgi:mRNA interferase RelE/StbE